MIFGATGMVGQGVLRECLLAIDVEHVVSVGRTRLEGEHSKLSQVLCPDLTNAEQDLGKLHGFDACFFCLGVSSSGMSEERYHKLTHDLTVDIAKVLSMNNPEMTFIYVSGAGTDRGVTSKGTKTYAKDFH